MNFIWTNLCVNEGNKATFVIHHDFTLQFGFLFRFLSQFYTSEQITWRSAAVDHHVTRDVVDPQAPQAGASCTGCPRWGSCCWGNCRCWRRKAWKPWTPQSPASASPAEQVNRWARAEELSPWCSHSWSNSLIYSNVDGNVHFLWQ